MPAIIDQGKLMNDVLELENVENAKRIGYAIIIGKSFPCKEWYGTILALMSIANDQPYEWVLHVQLCYHY